MKREDIEAINDNDIVYVISSLSYIPIGISKEMALKHPWPSTIFRYEKDACYAAIETIEELKTPIKERLRELGE